MTDIHIPAASHAAGCFCICLLFLSGAAESAACQVRLCSV
nr:MAG TPA: hypothetical protein [Caudoviricetes sp.]